LDDVLPSGGELASRADVLEHSQLPVRPQDALDLRQCPGRISHAAKNQTAHHRVEGTVAEGQLLRGAAHQRNCWATAAGALKSPRVGIQGEQANARIVKR